MSCTFSERTAFINVGKSWYGSTQQRYDNGCRWPGAKLVPGMMSCQKQQTSYVQDVIGSGTYLYLYVMVISVFWKWWRSMCISPWREPFSLYNSQMTCLALPEEFIHIRHIAASLHATPISTWIVFIKALMVCQKYCSDGVELGAHSVLLSEAHMA